MINKRQRFIALITALAMAAAMAFSVVFVVHSAEHECKKIDCQLCAAVHVCLERFQDTAPKPTQLGAVSLTVFAVIALLGAVREAAGLKTLITLKIKLSN